MSEPPSYTDIDKIMYEFKVKRKALRETYQEECGLATSQYEERVILINDHYNEVAELSHTLDQKDHDVEVYRDRMKNIWNQLNKILANARDNYDQKMKILCSTYDKIMIKK